MEGFFKTKPMNKILWVLGAILVFTAMSFSVIYFAEPKPQKMMTLSTFDDPIQLGRALYKRLRKQVHQGSVFLVGGEFSKNSILKDVFSEFVKNAKKDGAGFLATIGEVSDVQGIPLPMVRLPKVEMNDQKTLVALKEFERGHFRVLLVTNNKESQTWGRTQKFNDFEKQLKKNVISITVSDYMESYSDDLDDKQTCADSNDLSQKEFLSCARLNFSRRMRKKTKPEYKIKAALERYSADQYVLFFNEPALQKQN